MPADVVTDTYTFTTVRVDDRGVVVARPAGSVRRRYEELPGGIRLALIAVPGGRFTMGSPPGIGYPDERPAHTVTVAPFWLGQYPVTQAQWVAVMGEAAPFRGVGPDRPAENVSWHDAVAFCGRLSALTGHACGLPAEAQWEYACRGPAALDPGVGAAPATGDLASPGAPSAAAAAVTGAGDPAAEASLAPPFAFGATLTSDLADYVGEVTYRHEPPGIYRHGTTAAGSFPPNGFGLHDMHGNLWEWCADAWHADYRGAPADGSAWEEGGEEGYRVTRGGSWHDGPALCRSATRLRLLAAEGDDFIGFRVACLTN